jgi:hypothetical protein
MAGRVDRRVTLSRAAGVGWLDTFVPFVPMRFVPRLFLSILLIALPATASSSQIVGANADSIPNDSWVEIYFSSFDEAEKAAQLAPLRETPLRPGEREIRLWNQVELGVPKQLHRFTERDGRVRGEVVYYWSREPGGLARDERPGETMHDLMLYTMRGRCDRFTTSTEAAACRARYRREPPWKGALRAAEALGLWTLPDPSVLPKENTVGFDGTTMVVELRDGARYRTYQYHNPGMHPQWPSDSQAVRILGAMQAIDSLEQPPDVWRVYRGLTSGRYRSAFRSCDGHETWEFFTDLRTLLENADPAVRSAAPAAALDTTVRDDTMFEVEALGELAPEWLARRWETKYPRALQVIRLRAVRAVTSDGCR